MDRGPNHQQGSRPPDLKVSYASAAKDKMEWVKLFANLIENSKNEQNKIELKFTKLKNSSENTDRAARYIDLETISEYIFTELNLNPEYVLEIYLNSGRYNMKQFLLKVMNRWFIKTSIIWYSESQEVGDYVSPFTIV